MAAKQFYHLTIDGRPLCTFGALAYRSRLQEAGCDGKCEYDDYRSVLMAVARLSEQFPQRVGVHYSRCPESPAAA